MSLNSRTIYKINLMGVCYVLLILCPSYVSDEITKNLCCILFFNFSKKKYFEEHLRTAAFEMILANDCLELCFWTVAFKTILTRYCYKNSSRFQTRTLNTILCICRFYIWLPTLPFGPMFRMFIINGYYTKSKRL